MSSLEETRPRFMNWELPRLRAADWTALLALIACALLFQYLSEGSFLTSRNLSNLSRQVCVNLTLAVGMTVVILTSGIDLSVGSVLALAGMSVAISQVQWGWADGGTLGATFSVLLALGIGAGAGATNGFAVSRLGITPFIVTLGMMVIGRGLTLIVSGARAVAPVGDSLGSLSSSYLPPAASGAVLVGALALFLLVSYRSFARGELDIATGLRRLIVSVGGCAIALHAFCGYRGIPTMVFIAAGCVAMVYVALHYLRFGRFVYAIGDNREAALLSGVPVTRTLWSVYILMGALAGLAGTLDVARVNGAVPSAGELAELDAIAAVVIGGTSLMGGAGGVGGTILGVLLMGVLNNGMSLIGITEHSQKVFKGLVIILAVYLDTRAKRKA